MMKEHVHDFKKFVEKGCTDNRVYEVCECGKYRLISDA